MLTIIIIIFYNSISIIFVDIEKNIVFIIYTHCYAKWLHYIINYDLQMVDDGGGEGENAIKFTASGEASEHGIHVVSHVTEAWCLDIVA